MIGNHLTKLIPAPFKIYIVHRGRNQTQRRGAVVCATKSGGTGGNDPAAYSYNSGDGREKVSIEQVFQGDNALTQVQGDAPWKMGWQMNERNLVWNDDLKMRLVKVWSL